MSDVCVGGWLGSGVGSHIRGICLDVLDTQFAVVGGVDLVRPKACCRVSSLERRPLISRKLQFTSAALPTR